MSNWWQRLRELVVTLSPKWVSDIYQRGLTRMLLVVIAFTVVLPPMILIIGAYWVGYLVRSDWSVLRELGVSAVRNVHDNLATEAVMARSHTRLDYLQWFEVKLYPKTRHYRDLRIRLNVWQKAEIHVRLVKLIANTELCSIPEAELELVKLEIDGRTVGTLRPDSTNMIPLGEKWWDERGKHLEEGEQLRSLTFSLTDAATKLPCGEVTVEGAIQVFKDTYRAPAVKP